MDHFESVKNAFIKMLDEATAMYMVAGMGEKESPVWLSLRYPKLQDGEEPYLLFESSMSYVWMKVPCTHEEFQRVMRDPSKSSDYFKRLKYLHIKENYPTVWNEMDDFNTARVESFLKHGNGLVFWTT